MFKQNTLVAEPTEVIPPHSKSSKTISPDHKRALRKAPVGSERQVADRTATLTQANEQLRHEIKECRQTEELLLKEQRYLRCLLELVVTASD
jgi:C4-dicarboxylate-specific signal transduction histidine kinase